MNMNNYIIFFIIGIIIFLFIDNGNGFSVGIPEYLLTIDNDLEIGADNYITIVPSLYTSDEEAWAVNDSGKLSISNPVIEINKSKYYVFGNDIIDAQIKYDEYLVRTLMVPDVGVFERHNIDGSTAKIYTTTLDGRKVLFKVFNNLEKGKQEKEAQLQQEASEILQKHQYDFQIEFKRLIRSMTITKKRNMRKIEENIPTAIIPKILDYGNYEEMSAKYGDIPNQNGDNVGYVIIMEYIDENTVFEDLEQRNIRKIDLYKEWSRRSDVKEVIIDVNKTKRSDLFDMEVKADKQYSMKYSYLTNLLVSLLNIINKYNISHNDAQFKNVIVTFTDDGNIEYLYLIDFGQAERTPEEIGGNYQYTLFNMAHELRNAKKWWPVLYKD